MICLGSYKDKTWPDNWTSVTVDGTKSAQFGEYMTDNLDRDVRLTLGCRAHYPRHRGRSRSTYGEIARLARRTSARAWSSRKRQWRGGADDACCMSIWGDVNTSALSNDLSATIREPSRVAGWRNQWIEQDSESIVASLEEPPYVQQRLLPETLGGSRHVCMAEIVARHERPSPMRRQKGTDQLGQTHQLKDLP